MTKIPLINIAKRCQLLIGSYEGNPMECPCKSPKECPLSANELDTLRNVPEVQEAIQKSKDTYKALTDDTLN